MVHAGQVIGGPGFDDQNETWLLEYRLGKGGLGSVYAARNASGTRKVAIKVLNPEFNDERRHPGAIEAFVQEGEIANMLAPGDAAHVSGYGQTDSGQHYYVMDLLDGDDLAGAVFSPPVAAALGEKLLELEDRLHRLGITHRDIKPENIFLSDDSKHMRLVDFGASRIGTRPTVNMFTPGFAPPEQIFHQPNEDVGVDLYATGATLFNWLTGALPSNQRVPPYTHCPAPAVPIERLVPSLPPHLRDAINQALACNRGQRPQTAEAMLALMKPHVRDAMDMAKAG